MTTTNLRNGFEEQPNEVFELILTFLEYEDATMFRMTSKGYYNGLRMTVSEEHRNTVESNWREICDYGGLDHVKRILAQDEKIDQSESLYIASCDQFANPSEKGLPEDERTELFYFLWKDLNMDPSYYNNYAIGYASEKNCINLVKDLLKDGRVNPSANRNYAIRYASGNGHLNVVKELLKDERVNPSADDDYAIGGASANGHINVVKELLKDNRVNPSGSDDYAISHASRRGHINVVEELLKDDRVNPSALDNEAIRYANRRGHLNMVNEHLLCKQKWAFECGEGVT